MTWKRSRREHLQTEDGRTTNLAIDPQYGSDMWYVVDVQDDRTALADVLPKKAAREYAERLRDKFPGLYVPTRMAAKKRPSRKKK
jgi:hypothetical protein